MEPRFWHKRWESSEIGFHQKKVNVLLESYWQQHTATPNGKVFVPLCGKSKDICWLAEQGHPVIGVELSPVAVETFFSENSLSAEKSQLGPFESYKSGEIQLLVGDFFNLTEADLKGCQLVYDRASLTAFPPELRKRYVAHLQEILPQNAAIFLVTLDYDAEKMKGPPFPVPKSEVENFFGEKFAIDCLDSREVLEMNSRFVDKGLDWLDEVVYLLRPKGVV